MSRIGKRRQDGPSGMHARFWGSVRPSDGCWEWTGIVGKNGYGQIKVDGKTTGAHRVAWMMSLGEIPRGLMVMHACDNRKCVRVGHLSLGTHQDNMDDMKSKGRAHSPRGTRRAWVERGPRPFLRGHLIHGSKLTEEMALLALARAKLGDPLNVIARDMGVTPTCICSLVKGRTWKHLER